MRRWSDKAAEEAKKLADKAAEDELEAEILAEEEAKNKKALSGTFIMTVGHLSWGRNGKSHFYADKKPLINAKVMGSFSKTLLIWIKEGWIKKGSY